MEEPDFWDNPEKSNGYMKELKGLKADIEDFIAYGDNASKCLGVVGSGNRNFNNQYCLTAKQYSQRFGFPMLADFEMRGMLGDIKKVQP